MVVSIVLLSTTTRMTVSTTTKAADEQTALLGYHHHEQQQEVSFDTIFWTSILPEEQVARYSSDIRKLRCVLQIIRFFLPCFYFMPLSWILWLFRFTPSFGDEVLYPLIACLAETKDDSQSEKRATCGMLYKAFAGLGGCWDVENRPVRTLQPLEVRRALTTDHYHPLILNQKSQHHRPA